MTMIRPVSIALVFALAAIGAVSVAEARPAVSSPPLVLRAPARAFARLEIASDRPGRSLYVGEAVPMVIRAYFQGGMGVTLTGQPRLTTDGFTLANVTEKPQQTETTLRGLSYSVLTWTGVLTAIESGAPPPAVELPAQLSYVDRVAAPQTGRTSSGPAGGGAAQEEGDQDETDPFASLLAQSPFASDPFFARMFKGRDPFGGPGDPFAGMMDFGGRVRQHDVTLRAETRPLTVESLPAGAPAGFTGAVGSFEPTATLSEQRLHIGEPVTLTLRVRGRGSFDRLSSTGLPRTAELDSYGVKSTFTAGVNPLVGEKAFAQTVVPRRAGQLTIPRLAVTYFDPRTRRYETRETSPLPVTVDAVPGQVIATPARPASDESTASQAEATSERAHSLSDVVTTLTPAYRTPRYWWAMGIMISLALIAAAVGWGRRSSRVARLALSHRGRRVVTRRLREVNAAVSRGDAVGLFRAAREALQASLGALWRVPPEAISAADVQARLGTGGARIREIFEQADRLTYAGDGALPPRELEGWQRSIFTELRTLERST